MNRQEVEGKFQKAGQLKDWPGDYLAARREAEEAMAQWQAENPVLAAKEAADMAELKAKEEARKEADYQFQLDRDNPGFAEVLARIRLEKGI